jgi:hypothetical protein
VLQRWVSLRRRRDSLCSDDESVAGFADGCEEIGNGEKSQARMFRRRSGKSRLLTISGCDAEACPAVDGVDGGQTRRLGGKKEKTHIWRTQGRSSGQGCRRSGRGRYRRRNHHRTCAGIEMEPEGNVRTRRKAKSNGRNTHLLLR